MQQTTQPFAFTYTPQFADILENLQCSLILSAFQSGKVIILSSGGEEKIIQLPRNFKKPMGLAVSDDGKLFGRCRQRRNYPPGER